MVGGSRAGLHGVHRKEAVPADDGSEGVGPAEARSTRWPCQSTDTACLDSTVTQCETGEHWGELAYHTESHN